MFEATVDSVGPYALKNPRTPPSGSGTAHLATRDRELASPPTTTTRNASSPLGSTDASAAGVTNACVTPSEHKISASSAPPYTVVGAITIVDAEPNAISNSRTDASKLGEAKCSVRASAVSA
ncbi:hypothetical protein B0E55_02920 [Rhodococcus sp. 66b]|nr:hypothetical protein B0E55_02920 [Rhodococcus sp. 66b]